MNVERKAEALREASAGWREMGRRLEETVRGLDREVGNARTAHWQGPAAEAFDGDWTRLRKSVDEALPVFELAAADLDRAADHVEQTAPEDDTDDGSSAPAERVEPLPASYNVSYAFMALSQIGAALGTTFAGRRGGGGSSRGRGGLVREAAQPASQAPQGVDPFGPPDAGRAAKEKPAGGLGVARGRRGPARGETGTTPSATDPAEAQQPKPEPKRAEDSSASAAPEPAAEKAGTEAPEAPRPDPRRHGAFG